MALVNPGIALSVENFKVPNMLGMASEAESIQNAQVNRQAAQQEMRNADYAQAMKQSRDALAFVRTPDDYIAWSESLYQNPLLRDVLAKTGTTPEQSRARIAAELQQPGGLERLIQQSSATAAQLTDIMSGRLNTMAAERKAAAGQAQTAAQQAQIDAIMGRTGAVAPAASTAQAFPVAPPVDTGVYEPGTPGAINQMYAQSRTGQTPALNALAVEPTTTADPRLSQLAELDRLAIQGNAQAASAAKTLRSQLEFEQKMVTGQDPTKRYLNVGDGVVFDTRTQTYLPNPERRAKVGTPLPVVTPEGNVVYVAPEEAIGKTPGSQAPTAAERAKQAKAEKGRNAVDEVLTKIQGYYADLDKLRGVPSTERGAMQNIAAFGAAAVPMAGRALGTEEQQLRDQITQIRSALVREIKNATGMSAQELNSNVELQLALEAATDPTISIQANLETLRNLSQLYGSGKLAQQPQSAAGAETDPDIAEALKIIRGEQ